MEELKEWLELLNSFASLILSVYAISKFGQRKKNTSKKKRSRKRK